MFIENFGGFKEKYPCKTSIQLVLSKWKKLKEMNSVVDVTFLDFKIVFETINKDVLL